MLKKAGCIILSEKDPKKIVLVYRKEQDDYSFPKGHVEKNESYKKCAIRESKEETGLDVEILEEFGTMIYKNNIQEDVYNKYFIARSLDDAKLKPEQNMKVLFIDINDVKDKLTYENLKEFFRKNFDKLNDFI